MISCFLQRRLFPKNGFLLRLSYLASIKIVHDLLLPAETTVPKEWLSAETVCHIWLLSRLSMISCFLQRGLFPKNGFLLRLSYLASIKIVHDLLLPAERTVPKEWLPAETVCHIWLLSRLSMISCFLQGRLFPKNGFLLRLSYLASIKIVHDLLLPAETTVPKEWLPAETVCHIWLLSRLSMISCFLQRGLSPKNGFLLRLSVIFGFYQDCP